MRRFGRTNPSSRWKKFFHDFGIAKSAHQILGFSTTTFSATVRTCTHYFLFADGKKALPPRARMGGLLKGTPPRREKLTHRFLRLALFLCCAINVLFMILMATTRVFSLQQVTLYYHGKGFLQGRGRGKKAAPGGAQEVGGGQVKGAFLQASDAAVVGT